MGKNQKAAGLVRTSQSNPLQISATRYKTQLSVWITDTPSKNRRKVCGDYSLQI